MVLILIDVMGKKGLFLLGEAGSFNLRNILEKNKTENSAIKKKKRKNNIFI